MDPAHSRRLMDKVLNGLPFATSYIDDVLVHSPNMKRHLQQLQQVFERLANAGLTVRGSKCQFGLDKVPRTCIFRVGDVSRQTENSCDQGLADS